MQIDSRRSPTGSGPPTVGRPGFRGRSTGHHRARCDQAVPRHSAVDHLSFTVTAGKVTGFLGPNGTGKTTTIRVILGLARPDSGAATLLGKPYGEIDNPWSRVGALIDASSFHPLRTARAHLAAVAAAAKLPNPRVDEVLQEVELGRAADRKVGEYSLGMSQRLGLATALPGDPDLLILDEPANGLDPAGIPRSPSSGAPGMGFHIRRKRMCRGILISLRQLAFHWILPSPSLLS